MDDTFDSTTYVISPPVDAWVERLADNALLLHWTLTAERVEILVTADPDVTEGHPLATVSGENIHQLVVDTLPAGRPYFELRFVGGSSDGQRLIVAERELPLPGAVNFRDIGGYRTRDGRITRWGRLYRAGSLAELSDEEVAYLGGLGLRLACDLRTADEMERHPDRLPPNTVAWSRPIVGNVSRLRRVITLYRKRHHIQEVLLAAYVVMLDQNGPVFADVFRATADPANLPMVVHCTAGKDRTGLAVALLLLALGVPEETVIADYTLSNNAYEVLAGRMRPEMSRLYSFGFDEGQLRPFLLAEARTLEAALAYLRRRYGSLDWYLQKAGITDDIIDRLRENLLY